MIKRQVSCFRFYIGKFFLQIITGKCVLKLCQKNINIAKDILFFLVLNRNMLTARKMLILVRNIIRMPSQEHNQILEKYIICPLLIKYDYRLYFHEQEYRNIWTHLCFEQVFPHGTIYKIKPKVIIQKKLQQLQINNVFFYT